jgi:MFS family permease
MGMRKLPVIVIAQFLCTSLWFAGNAATPDIVRLHRLQAGFLAHLTSAVQFGFITGTFLFALFAISDRFSPSRVFFVSSLLAGGCNLGLLVPSGPGFILCSRFLTGFMLAGIYPVGMKIAADYNPQSLGKSLGFLVGALVAGTALPHLLKALPGRLSLQFLVIATSALSLMGGTMLLLLVPDGPHRRTAQGLKLTAAFVSFRNRSFRSVAFGYFGHMWELYTFWAFVPVILAWSNERYGTALDVPLLSFAIIGAGSMACAFSGLLSRHIPAKRIAMWALALSGLCCLLSPFILQSRHSLLLILFLFFWGLVVIADSPMFSSLVAYHADATVKGTALTIINCIGFSITIISIQTLNMLSGIIRQPYIYLILAIGPVLGFISLLNGKADRS